MGHALETSWLVYRDSGDLLEQLSQAVSHCFLHLDFHRFVALSDSVLSVIEALAGAARLVGL